jgi:predicted dithiol-disulfide oxidoreductase (DUF899 family)
MARCRHLDALDISVPVDEADRAIHHFWGSEMSFAPTVPNQHHRAGDLADALWGLLDMTPEGRGKFFPKVNYE